MSKEDLSSIDPGQHDLLVAEDLVRRYGRFIEPNLGDDVVVSRCSDSPVPGPEWLWFRIEAPGMQDRPCLFAICALRSQATLLGERSFELARIAQQIATEKIDLLLLLRSPEPVPELAIYEVQGLRSTILVGLSPAVRESADPQRLQEIQAHHAARQIVELELTLEIPCGLLRGSDSLILSGPCFCLHGDGQSFIAKATSQVELRVDDRGFDLVDRATLGAEADGVSRAIIGHLMMSRGAVGALTVGTRVTAVLPESLEIVLLRDNRPWMSGTVLHSAAILTLQLVDINK